MSTARSFNQSVFKAMFILAGVAIGLFATAALVATYYLGRDFAATRMNHSLSLVEQRVNLLLHDAVQLNWVMRRSLPVTGTSAEPPGTWLASKADLFDLYPDISYLGLGLQASGEYYMLERLTNSRAILNRETVVLPDGSRVQYDYEIRSGQRRYQQTLPWDHYDPRERPFYQAARQAGRAVWTDTYLFWEKDARGQMPGITYASPIYDAGTNLLGVVDVDFDLLNLSTFLRQAGDVRTGYCVIVEQQQNGAQVIVAHPDPSLIVDPQTKYLVTNSASVRDPIVRAVLTESSGLKAAGLHSIRVGGVSYYWQLLALTGPNQPHWSIITLVPQSVVQWEVVPMYFGLAGAVMILLGLSFWLALRLARRVSRPLLDFEQQLYERSTQSEPLPVTVFGASEMLRLGEAFNRLIARIKERRDELVEMNLDLKAQNDQRQQAEAALRETARRIEQQQLALVECAERYDLLAQDVSAAFRKLTELGVRALAVERASIWLLSPDSSVYRCVDLYIRTLKQHSATMELKQEDFPIYFSHLSKERALVVSDVNADLRTQDFAAGHLNSLGVMSVLSVPVSCGGRMVGMLVLAHIGAVRRWHSDEEVFAVALGNLTALAIEEEERRKTEVELARHRDHLEELVRARTSELSRMNLLLATEVHERKRAETELQEANGRLKELDRLKSEFLATMSHELRTPLNSIIGFSGIIRQRLAGPTTPEQDKQLGMILGSARHLLGLINDLLDLSRIESGKMDVHRTWFKLSEMAENVVRTLDPLAAAKQLPLQLRMDDPDLEVFSDQKKVFQVLLNLANNAVKFTDQGEVAIIVEVRAQNVSLRVRDTGVGIKPEHMPTLFAAFRQLDGSARRVYEGTGLGLYLCKKLANMLGGEITATSEYGRGSEFCFSFPIMPENPATHSP